MEGCSFVCFVSCVLLCFFLYGVELGVVRKRRGSFKHIQVLMATSCGFALRKNPFIFQVDGVLYSIFFYISCTLPLYLEHVRKKITVVIDNAAAVGAAVAAAAFVVVVGSCCCYCCCR